MGGEGALNGFLSLELNTINSEERNVITTSSLINITMEVLGIGVSFLEPKDSRSLCPQNFFPPLDSFKVIDKVDMSALLITV